MKKITMLLLICLSLLCYQKANGQQTYTIPIKITHDSTSYMLMINRIDTTYISTTYKLKNIDTIHKYESDYEMHKSKIIKRNFGSYLYNETYTELELEDGHIVKVSSAHNYTIAPDIVGSEYTYWKKKTITYDEYDTTYIYNTIYDTIYTTTYDTLYDGSVNLACVYVDRFDEYYGYKTNTRYYAKMYSYSRNEKFIVEVDRDFYLKYLNTKPHSKKYYKKQNITISFFDFLMLHQKTITRYYYVLYYDFAITEKN